METPLERLVDGLERLYAGVFLVVALKQDPWRERRGSEAEHVVDRLLVLRVFVAVTPVFLRDLPNLGRIDLARLEAAQLLFWRDVDPELQKYGAPLHEFVFEGVYLVVGTRPLVG